MKHKNTPKSFRERVSDFVFRLLLRGYKGYYKELGETNGIKTPVPITDDGGDPFGDA